MTEKQKQMLKSAKLLKFYDDGPCIAWAIDGVYESTPVYPTIEQAYSAFYLLVAIEGGYVLGGK